MNTEKHLNDSYKNLKEAFEAGRSGSDLNMIATKRYDRHLKDIFQGECARRGGLSLVALGGYGRCEMAPFSDVDIMLLAADAGSANVKDIMHSLLHPLWNAGVEVTGVVRTLPDCRRAAGMDIRSLTSMFDGRLIAGDEGLFEGLKNDLNKYFSDKRKSAEYIRKKLNEYHLRLKKYGDSVFVSEPHIKEGEGGLRCYHTYVWISKAARGVNSPEICRGDKEEWEDALGFLWRVRHGLHLESGRRQDRLDYARQEALSKRMAGESAASDPKAALEEFMHNFYRRAAFIHLAVERFLGGLADAKPFQKKGRKAVETAGKEIFIKGGAVYISPSCDLCDFPAIAFRAWALSHEKKLCLAYDAKEAIRRASGAWTAPLAEGHEVVRHFRKIMEDPRGLDKALMDMHETGVIFKLLPVFEKLRHRVQYDAYHLYTVDIHTIFLIREFSKIASGEYDREFPHISGVFKDLARPEILVLAGLLHDIGKGFERKERHDYFGAGVAKKVAADLGYSAEDQGLVEFFVRSHLILPQIAFCRDIDDPQMIENLASSVRTYDNLVVLYLLTFADIRATGPELWSSWKQELLASLFEKTAAVLTGRGFTEKNIGEHIREKEDGLPRTSINWIRSMPVRYVVKTPADAIARHFSLLHKNADAALELDVEQTDGQPYHVATVLTKDAPGLFARICGAFAANNINILEAQLYTGSNGDVVDLFKVVSGGGRRIRNDFNWKKVKCDLNEPVLAGGELPESLPSKVRRQIAVRQRRRGYGKEVAIDNDVSAYYTVVEIHAEDEIGLLHRVALWFYKNGFDIFMAKATTHIGQAIDIFYINDEYGNKIESKKTLAGIKDGLMGILGEH